jgi:hypothetical protein
VSVFAEYISVPPLKPDSNMQQLLLEIYPIRGCIATVIWEDVKPK